MSDEYKARLHELMQRRADQMLLSFDQPVVRVSDEFFSLCEPILTSELKHKAIFASNE